MAWGLPSCSFIWVAVYGTRWITWSNWSMPTVAGIALQPCFDPTRSSYYDPQKWPHLPWLQFNFAGKLLGPKGSSLKKLQEDTGSKMSILGRGVMRDRNKVCMVLLKWPCNLRHLIHMNATLFVTSPHLLSLQEEELRKQGGKFSHLNEEQHVLVEVFAHPVEAYQRMAAAVAELRRYLVPVSALFPLIFIE